ncbi:MAG: cache domain-containing protein [Propionivibrio sp.]
MSLEIRRAIVQTTAAQIVATHDHGTDVLRSHLEAVQTRCPEFVWLGVADSQGRVVAATGAAFYGENVAASQWFQKARQASFLGDVRQAPLLQQRLAHEAPQRPLRVIDIAAPIIHPGEASVGVLGAQLSWDWIDKHQSGLLQALDSQRQLELILVAEDATVLAGPPGWLGRKLEEQSDFTERGAYLVGRRAVSPPGDENDLDWAVVVRQSADAALAPAHTTRRIVFLTVLLAGLAAALATVLTTRVLTRRLAALSDSAMAVQQGLRSDLEVPASAPTSDPSKTALTTISSRPGDRENSF